MTKPDNQPRQAKANLGKLDIRFQSQFQETPSGVKVSSTLLRKLRGIDISEDHNVDAGEDR